MYQLELKHVQKYYYDKNKVMTAGLFAIDLAIPKGMVVALLGTNGAGKSTLLNAITGQTPIDGGEIYLAGDRIDLLSQEKIAPRIGRVFQNTDMGVAPRMTVFENLMLAKRKGDRRLFGRSLNAQAYQAMQHYLSGYHLDLEHRLDIPIENLSGGQKQIIALVMATMQEPDLLLLDEHTAALDPRTGKQVMALTHQLVRDMGLTTLMVTHHLQDALDFADNILIMHRGRIVEAVSAEQKAAYHASDLFQLMETIANREDEALPIN